MKNSRKFSWVLLLCQKEYFIYSCFNLIFIFKYSPRKITSNSVNCFWNIVKFVYFLNSNLYCSSGCPCTPPPSLQMSRRVSQSYDNRLVHIKMLLVEKRCPEFKTKYNCVSTNTYIICLFDASRTDTRVSNSKCDTYPTYHFL